MFKSRKEPHAPQRVVVEAMADINVESRSQMKVLDLPAGNGIISFPLAAAGFKVHMLDLFPSELVSNLEQFRKQGLESVLENYGEGYLSDSLKQKLLNGSTPDIPQKSQIVQGDLEKRIPFQKETFDYVLCVEGIEHIDAQLHFIKEARRVLRRGGKLFMTTPNKLSLRSRLAYAFTGQRTLKSFIDEDTEQHGKSPNGERIYHGHVFLVDYYQLRYYLHNSGFRITRLLTCPSSFSSVMLAPLTLPPTLLFSKLTEAHGHKKWSKMMRSADEMGVVASPHQEIHQHVFLASLLFSNTLAIEAVAV